MLKETSEDSKVKKIVQRAKIAVLKAKRVVSKVKKVSKAKMAELKAKRLV